MTRCKDCGAMYERKQFPHCPVCIPEADTTAAGFDYAAIAEADKLDRVIRDAVGPSVTRPKLPHVTQITLTDRDLALLTNAIQLATVISKGDLKKPKIADSARKGLEALDTFSTQEMIGLTERLQDAAEGITDDSVTLDSEETLEL